MTQHAPATPAYVAHPVIATVDADDSQTVVWWTRLPRLGMSSTRHCGAWTIGADDPHTLLQVVSRRIVLPTPGGRKALAEARVTVEAELDPASTWQVVLESGEQLAEALRSLKAAAKRETALPTAPTVLDLDARDPHAPAPVSRALGIAQQVEALVGYWDRLEDIRMVRKSVRGHNGVDASPDPRTMPYALATA